MISWLRYYKANVLIPAVLNAAAAMSLGQYHGAGLIKKDKYSRNKGSWRGACIPFLPALVTNVLLACGSCVLLLQSELHILVQHRHQSGPWLRVILCPLWQKKAIIWQGGEAKTHIHTKASCNSQSWLCCWGNIDHQLQVKSPKPPHLCR